MVGYLGVGWSWYLILENWNSVFIGNFVLFFYNELDVEKVVILMMDGEFNVEIFLEQGFFDWQV